MTDTPIFACNENSAELFYEFIPGRGFRWEWRAKALCAGCPGLELCRAECDKLEAELPFMFWHGIWAGQTPYERAIRRGVRVPSWALPAKAIA